MNPVCRRLIVAQSVKIQNAVNPVWRTPYCASLTKKIEGFGFDSEFGGDVPSIA